MCGFVASNCARGDNVLRTYRITCVIASLAGGGAERNLIRLAEALGVAGHSVTLLTTNPDVEDFYPVAETVQRVRAEPTVFLSCRWFNMACQTERKKALRASLLATKPDLVISFIDSTNISTLAALRGLSIPVIVSERIDPRMHPISWRWQAMRWWVYPHAARVVMLTGETVTWARRMWPRWKVLYIPNPVFPVGEVASRNALPVISAMGRLVPQKGFDLLIRAFFALAEQFPEWKLQIIGDGPERIKLETQIEVLGLKERILLTGVLKNPFPVLAKSSLFVFSSRYEGFPNAITEAMAIGLPVISFDCPTGPRMIIRNEVDGLLVPPEDVNALADAMRRLIGDPAERTRLANRAPEVRERFSPKRIFGQWLALVDEVMTEHK